MVMVNEKGQPTVGMRCTSYYVEGYGIIELYESSLFIVDDVRQLTLCYYCMYSF